MGMALTQAALQRGWPVTLLLGPVTVNPPQDSHLRLERFHTATDLQRLLHELWPAHDLLLMAAAVADFAPAPLSVGPVGRASVPASLPEKLKREDTDRDGGWTLKLVSTPDILASLAAISRPDQTAIGFALEPAAELEGAAQRKLRGKHLDAIIANPLATMDSPKVSATLLWRDGQSVSAPRAMAKDDFAVWLLERVEPFVQKKLQHSARNGSSGGV
jgi:phosphopantothenoylcysteine decarboxylase/phosphopantothenate--cysteine ligase